VRAKGGFVYKFNGFRSQDKETIKEFVSTTFGLEVEDGQFSYKGWNWGQTAVEGNNVLFSVEGKQAIEMPLTDIAQATSQKNEAVLEMVADDTAFPEDELLVEVRFHIPAAAGEEAEVDGTPAERFIDLIKQSGDLEVAGASLMTLDDMPLQVPRGRYNMEMCDKFMKLHGKSNDYKVLYTNVASLYLLPKHDGSNMVLCVCLEHPLRQGATSYPHIVLQLPRDAPMEAEVALSEAECTQRFGDKLDKFESGDTPSVVAKVISAFTKRKVQGIKAGGFNATSSEDRSKSMRCSLKAAEGHLFPLDKAFFFISNKPCLIEFDRIASIEFSRVDQTQQAARTFDITVHVKDSSGDLQFSNLQRSDYKELFRFLTSKKIRIKNIAAASSYDDGAGGRDDDDDDDPYMATVRREREEAKSAMMGLDDDDDDDDDEDDEDFQGGSGSDVDEEFDEGSESDEDRMAPADKQAAKKRKKDDEGSDDDDGSDSEEKPLKKPPKAAKSEKKEGKAEGKKKKPKKKKDKDAPKRGQSAYMLWMNGAGRTMAKEAGETGIGNIGKWCGAKWKEMEAEEKAQWEEKAQADKARYEGEMAAYKAKARAEAVAAAADDSDSDNSDDEAAPDADSD